MRRIPHQIEAATAARLRLGVTTDAEVQAKIADKPGLSVYGLAQKLGCSVGRVDGSVARLEEQGKIDVQYVVREGKIVKELYPKGSIVTSTEQEVKIDKDMLARPGKWTSKAFVYALDRMTLGIAPLDSDQWSEKALVKEKVAIRDSDGSVLVKIPPRLAHFYLWKNSASDLSVVGDRALITLKTRIPIQISKVETGELERTGGRANINISIKFDVFTTTTEPHAMSSEQTIRIEPARGTGPIEVVAGA